MTDDAESRIAEIIEAADQFASSRSDHGKPRLLIDAANPDVTVAALRDILSRSGDLYDRGVVARVVRDEQLGALTTAPVTADNLVMVVHSKCRPYCMQGSKQGEPPAPRDCRFPKELANMYLDWRGEWRLPVLNGIASSPLLKDDGSIVSTPGYDIDTGIWLEKVPDIEPLVPLRPTRDDAERALRRLRAMLATWCFADATTVRAPDIEQPLVDIVQRPGSDESGALIALLTAVCRASLHLAPGVLITAASMSGSGSGKGLLARLIAAVATGSEPRAVTGGGSAQELEKRIGAELIQGGATLFLDNLNDRSFKSDLLASAITERPARVRLLGKSEMAQLNATALVVLTGNGLSVSEDLARRFISIELDAKTEDPEARRFPGDILEDVKRCRSELLAAALTIWRWGRLAVDIPEGRPLGSFEQWGRWVRDPLVALGCRDPAERTAHAKQQDARRQGFAEVFNLWWEHHGSAPVKANRLHDDIKAILDPQGRGRQYLVSRVQTLAGTRLAGFVLTRQAAVGGWGTATFALVRSNDEEGHRDHRDHRGDRGDTS
jgi:hypothetical protein